MLSGLQARKQWCKIMRYENLWKRLFFCIHLTLAGLLNLLHMKGMIAIYTELRKLGAIVEEGPDYCVISPPEKLKTAEIDTYDDHRMAMAFSLAASADVPVTIKNPCCTRKTFPDYFQVLERVTKQ